MHFMLADTIATWFRSVCFSHHLNNLTSSSPSPAGLRQPTISPPIPVLHTLLLSVLVPLPTRSPPALPKLLSLFALSLAGRTLPSSSTTSRTCAHCLACLCEAFFS